MRVRGMNTTHLYGHLYDPVVYYVTQVSGIINGLQLIIG